MEIFRSIFTLKTKLIFLFLILALVPLAIIGIFSIQTTETLIENLVFRQLENVAADKASILERWLEERKHDLQVIAGTSIVKSLNPEIIAPYLELIQHHYGVYKNIAVISTAHEIIFSTNARHPAIAAHAWDPGATRETLFLSSITYLPGDQESAFHLATPILTDDQALGTVLGTVGTNKIIFTVLRVALGQTGECYLVDKNGTFLAHKEPRRILTENIAQSESFRNIFGARDRRKAYLDYRNIEVLGTSQKIAGTDWYIVVEQDRDEAFESVEKLKHYIYFTVLLAMGSALLLTWAFSFHIVRPIRTLSRSAHKLARDEFDTTAIDTDRQDEIGLLCRAFADMAQRIQERRDTLEQKVINREAELKETDLTLKQFKLIAARSEKFAALGRLGAAVAHEIRTPLTSLKLFMESVQAEIEISPEYLEDFEVAMGQIARIETAIHRLLDFTKPKALIFSQISIAQLINDVVFIVKPLANKQECIVAVDLADDLPAINADKQLLEEALINLLINSLEALSVKGRISVAAKTQTRDASGSAGSCIRIDIGDEGTGIAAEHMDLIFEPFFTTKSSGTGLGLPMVLDTVKRHDGEVRVQSDGHRGTVFSIWLPVKSIKPADHGKDSDH